MSRIGVVPGWENRRVLLTVAILGLIGTLAASGAVTELMKRRDMRRQ